MTVLPVFLRFFFQCGQLQTGTEHLGGQPHILQGREAGGDADVGIFRVIPIGVRGPGGGHDQPGLRAQLHRPPGAAVPGIQADEIAALGVGPPGDPQLGGLLYCTYQAMLILRLLATNRKPSISATPTGREMIPGAPDITRTPAIK